MLNHYIRILLLVMTGLIAVPVLSSAQTTPPPYQTPRQLTSEERARQQQQDEEAVKACAVCGGGIATMGIIVVVLFALNIALFVWVARDAKSRGMDSSILWMFLVMFTSVIGLVIYLFSRPQGALVQCPHCKGKRLSVSAICPHCHHT